MSDIIKRTSVIGISVFLLTALVLFILDIVGYYSTNDVVFALTKIAAVLILAVLIISFVAYLNYAARSNKEKGKE